MSKQVFRPGPPPHVGWWWTKFDAVGAWRWFDGDTWSAACYVEDAPEDVAYWAGMPLWGVEFIKWSRYWPKNARVQRVAP